MKGILDEPSWSQKEEWLPPWKNFYIVSQEGQWQWQWQWQWQAAQASDVHDQIDPHFSPAIGFITTWPILVRTKPRTDKTDGLFFSRFFFFQINLIRVIIGAIKYINTLCYDRSKTSTNTIQLFMNIAQINI